MSSSEAIDYIRTLRPGSVETKDQEVFIKDY
jgi:protein-tyrosine phosphatase